MYAYFILHQKCIDSHCCISPIVQIFLWSFQIYKTFHFLLLVSGLLLNTCSQLLPPHNYNRGEWNFVCRTLSIEKLQLSVHSLLWTVITGIPWIVQSDGNTVWKVMMLILVTNCNQVMDKVKFWPDYYYIITLHHEWLINVLSGSSSSRHCCKLTVVPEERAGGHQSQWGSSSGDQQNFMVVHQVVFICL